jgi:hypothetical protein
MRAYWNNLSRVERESELDAIGRRAGFAYYQWDELPNAIRRHLTWRASRAPLLKNPLIKVAG